MGLKTADVEGVRMRWLEQGEGFPVVLIHGVPTGPRLWRGVMPRLENARALAWEMSDKLLKRGWLVGQHHPSLVPATISPAPPS